MDTVSSLVVLGLLMLAGVCGLWYARRLSRVDPYGMHRKSLTWALNDCSKQLSESHDDHDESAVKARDSWRVIAHEAKHLDEDAHRQADREIRALERAAEAKGIHLDATG